MTEKFLIIYYQENSIVFETRQIYYDKGIKEIKEFNAIPRDKIRYIQAVHNKLNDSIQIWGYETTLGTIKNDDYNKFFNNLRLWMDGNIPRVIDTFKCPNEVEDEKEKWCRCSKNL